MATVVPLVDMKNDSYKAVSIFQHSELATILSSCLESLVFTPGNGYCWCSWTIRSNHCRNETMLWKHTNRQTWIFHDDGYSSRTCSLLPTAVLSALFDWDPVCIYLHLKSSLRKLQPKIRLGRVTEVNCWGLICLWLQVLFLGIEGCIDKRLLSPLANDKGILLMDDKLIFGDRCPVEHLHQHQLDLNKVCWTPSPPPCHPSLRPLVLLPLSMSLTLSPPLSLSLSLSPASLPHVSKPVLSVVDLSEVGAAYHGWAHI